MPEHSCQNNTQPVDTGLDLQEHLEVHADCACSVWELLRDFADVCHQLSWLFEGGAIKDRVCDWLIVASSIQHPPRLLLLGSSRQRMQSGGVESQFIVIICRIWDTVLVLHVSMQETSLGVCADGWFRPCLHIHGCFEKLRHFPLFAPFFYNQTRIRLWKWFFLKTPAECFLENFGCTFACWEL